MRDDSSGREREIADVRGLFGDEDEGLSASPAARTPGASNSPGDGYELEDGGVEPPVSRAEPRPAPAHAPRRAPKPKPRPEETREFEDEEEASVDEIWTRWEEWKSTILRMAAGGVAVIFVTYLATNFGGGTAFLVLVLGVAVLVALSYPIAITMERPVRIAPEQAAKDFYAAASHHFPHYRRMWLLLSTNGRRAREFDSFAAFQTYWKHQMTKLRGTSVKSTTPLTFRVLDFDADKSVGKTSTDARYRLLVTPRGEDGNVLLEASIATSLVRGADRMWYLNQGALPAVARDPR